MFPVTVYAKGPARGKSRPLFNDRALRRKAATRQAVNNAMRGTTTAWKDLRMTGIEAKIQIARTRRMDATFGPRRAKTRNMPSGTERRKPEPEVDMLGEERLYMTGYPKSAVRVADQNSPSTRSAWIFVEDRSTEWKQCANMFASNKIKDHISKYTHYGNMPPRPPGHVE